MRYKLIYIILLLAFFASCSKEKDLQVEVIKSVGFKTGLTGISHVNINYCYDKNLQKNFVFFANRESFIKSFDLEGNLIDSITLNNYIDIAFERPLRFSPYTLDTIVLYPYCNNLVAFINNKGDILKNCYIND